MADPEFRPIEKKVDEAWKETVERERRQPPSSPREERTTAGGPVTFETIVSNLAMQAWMALGQAPNPATGQRAVHPEQAQFIIDMLTVMKEKTKGNLQPNESALLDQYLYELRMAFLQVTGGGAQPGPGQPRPAGKPTHPGEKFTSL